jgi:hypothetical protein
MAFDLAATQWVARAVAGKGGVDKAVRQMLVAPGGNAQARSLHDLRRTLAEILDEQALRIETLTVPNWNLQAERLA